MMITRIAGMIYLHRRKMARVPAEPAAGPAPVVFWGQEPGEGQSNDDRCSVETECADRFVHDIEHGNTPEGEVRCTVTQCRSKAYEQQDRGQDRGGLCP